MPTNKTVISVITTTVALMTFGCVITVCLLAYCGIMIPPELNTLTGTLCGALTGMLVKTTPTETTKQIAVATQPIVVDAESQPPKL